METSSASKLASNNSFLGMLSIAAAIGAIAAIVAYSQKRKEAASAHPLKGVLKERRRTFTNVMKFPVAAIPEEPSIDEEQGSQSDYVRV